MLAEDREQAGGDFPRGHPIAHVGGDLGQAAAARGHAQGVDRLLHGPKYSADRVSRR